MLLHGLAACLAGRGPCLAAFFCASSFGCAAQEKIEFSRRGRVENGHWDVSAASILCASSVL